MHLLVVEDDPRLAALLARLLGEERHVVEVAATGREALDLADGLPGLDAVVLDVGLPDVDGLTVARRLRTAGRRTPILMLTARDTVADRVDGLDSGADDYLVKPFAFEELSARLRALVRRADGTPREGGILRAGSIALDETRRTVTADGSPVNLTAREYELLEYLLRYQGSVVSREMLARDVWRETARATPIDNVIDVHVARLRRKIDDNFDRKLLHTVRGVGFILREEGQ